MLLHAPELPFGVLLFASATNGMLACSVCFWTISRLIRGHFHSAAAAAIPSRLVCHFRSDPTIRHITPLDPNDENVGGWLARFARGRERLLQLFRRERNAVQAARSAFWEGHEGVESRLEGWLQEPPTTFLLLTGANGTGKVNVALLSRQS